MSRAVLAVALPLLALAAACTDAGEPAGLLQPEDALLSSGQSGGPVIASITGSGHQETAPPALNPGLWRTFSMNARKYADGSVKGSYNRLTHLEDGGVERGYGSIVCFTIIGNTAWVGGTVPGNSPPDVAWQVVDNGEGADGTPDQVGLQFEAELFGFEAGFAQGFCENTPESLDFGDFGGVVPLSLLLKDIEAGNIQIRSGE